MALTSTPPAPPTPTQVARQAIKAVVEAPATGVPLLLSLLRLGTLEADTPVARGGPALMDALLALVMADGAGGDVAKAVMARPAQEWDEAVGGQAFARRLADGRWAPSTWLQALCKVGTVKRGEGWNHGKADAWLAHTLAQVGLEDGAAHVAMAQALRLDMTCTIDVLWDRVDLGRKVGDKRVLLAHGSSSHAWERYLERGGDPLRQVDGVPLWLAIVLSHPTGSPKPEKMDGIVERWGWAHLASTGGGQTPDERSWISKAAASRANKAGAAGLSKEDWLAMLQALTPTCKLWDSVGADRGPIWWEVALKTNEKDFLPFLASTELGRWIGVERLDLAQARLLGQRVASAPQGYERGALEDWKQAFDSAWWPKAAPPAVVDLAQARLGRNAVRQLVRLGQAHPRRWWGAEEDLPATGVALVKSALGLLRQDRDKGLPRLKTLAGLLEHAPGDPGILLARGLALLVAGPDPGIPPDLAQGAEGLAARGPEVLAWLDQATPSVPRNRRAAFQALVEAGRMWERLPAAAARNRGPGRL